MGDLARRRSARDLWISRSHVWALGAAAVVAVGVAFLGGYTWGRGEAEAPKRVAYTEPAADEELVEVLARVEANVRADGGVQELTFPDALTTPVEGDPPPPGSFTVEVARFGSVDTARPLRDHLRAANLSAWLGVERIDGKPVYRVAVGGHPSEAAAESHLDAIREALEAYAGPAGEPKVVPRDP